MSYGLSDEGFSYMTAPVIYDGIAAGMRNQERLSGLRTGPESKFANESAPFVEVAAKVWETLGALYDSLNPDSATKTSLDNRAASIGKSRYPQKKSKVPLTLYNRTSTSPVTVFADSQVKQPVTGILWATLEDAEIPALTTLHTELDIDAITNQGGTVDRITFNGNPDLSAVSPGDTLTITDAANDSNNGTFSIVAVNVGGYFVDISNEDHSDGTDNEASDTDAKGTINDTETSVIVNAESLDYGAFQASVDTITAINTPVPGWDGVSNLTAAEVGQTIEKDSDFRARILANPVISQGGISPAIVNRLREVNGVTYATVEENDTAAIVDGMEPNSIRATVVGGTDQDIWDCLGQFKGAGIGTNGTEVGVYIDEQGVEKPVRFNRVTKINPYIRVEITKGSGFPTTTATTTIQEALAKIVYLHGEDLIVHRLVAAVSDLRLTDTLAITVKVSEDTNPPTVSDNLDASATEVFVVDPNRITVVLS